MSEEKTTSGSFKIRPAGRHILTIGRDLIQDSCAAVVELVKNAYDADATYVSLSFKRIDGVNPLQIVIDDNGHGMTRDVVTSKWMVPSTNDKEKRKKSPKGRIMQGRKGIGRYAASILGNELYLETVSNKEKTDLLVNWNEFQNAEYLSDVEIQIDTNPSNESSKTTMTIRGESSFLEEWTPKQFEQLKKELKKLMTPICDTKVSGDINFDIFLSIEGFFSHDIQKEKIEPFPLLALYDYKIYGKIENDGKGSLIYEMQKIRNASPEKINFDFEGPTNCGNVIFDIRVFDREKEAIDDLIKRGLKDDSGAYVGKLEARRLLNENNGIGVYRNGFRIRPLGDPDFDWLELNKQRVQNPSLKIGSDQVIGFVKIESEEKSCLIEKSARDGLKENIAYESLIKLTRAVIQEIETRRYLYRSKTGLSRKTLKVESEFEKLFSFSALKKKMQVALAHEKISENTSKKIVEAIEEAEKEKNEIAESLRETIAVYQGQATLGKIIDIVLHEGRKPLEFFGDQVPLFKSYYKQYLEGHIEKLPVIYNKVDGIALNSEMLVMLFKKINPLAVGRRARKQKIKILDCLRSVFSVFESQLKNVSWLVESSTGEDIEIECWKQDIYSAFTNLIENSLFWMDEKNVPEKKISINVNIKSGLVEYIDYRDSGPGIDEKLIESGVIFEPNFSTKNGGTGLGLSIAGEASRRFGFDLKALASDSGAYFRFDQMEGM